MTKRKIKRSIIDKQDPLVATHTGNRVLYGLMDPKEEQQYLKGNIHKSRSDYARIVDIRIPQGYHAQIKKSWEMYELDRLFRYLIDRITDFAANGFEWELPLQKPREQSWLDFINKILGKKNKDIEKLEKEKAVWDKWASTINKDVPNVMPGLDEVLKWIFKSFQLNAMAPLNWEWDTVEIDGEQYELPVRMTLQNCLSVVLRRKSSNFADEEFWIKLSRQEYISESNKADANVSGMHSTPQKNDPYWHEIPIMNSNKGNNSKEQGFVIKYQWSPSDNTALNQGRNITIGRGLYPTPPYVGMYDILLLRRALIASDLAILDGVIHYILDWSIGDDAKDQNNRLVNQPRVARKDSSGAIVEKSSIQLAKEAITADNRGPVMQIFHPYYYKLDIRTPDVKSLISSEKYNQSTVELLSGFGILVPPPGRNLDFNDINIQNFEETLESSRKTIKRFIESLCAEIVERNKGKLTVLPNLIFNVLNTKLEAFRTAILNLVKIGKVSTETLHQIHGLDSKVEIPRIGREIISGTKELMDKNVPISYKQIAVDPSGNVIDSSVSPGMQGGRPKREEGGGGKKPRPKKEDNQEKNKLEKFVNAMKLKILDKQSDLLDKLNKEDKK